MDVELRTLDDTVNKQVGVESLVVERDGLQGLHSSPQPDPVALLVGQVKGPQPVIRDPSQNSL